MRFGLRGEERAFHAYVGTALVYLHITQFTGRFQQEFAECGTEWLGEGAVYDDAAFVEGVHAALRSVK